MSNPLYRAKLLGKEADDIASSLLKDDALEVDSNAQPGRRQSRIASPESYVILPGKVHGGYSYPELLVSVDRKYNGNNWFKAHEKLHKDDSFMLTPRQFVDFLELLMLGKVYDGAGGKIDSSRVSQLLEDITTKRDPYRAEWLDADFKVVGGKLMMNYNHRTISGKLVPQNIEQLESCLMEDCYVDLSSANRQGFPTRKSSNQEFYFWHPLSDNNSVARFWADSGRVYLSCSWFPQVSDSGLGVRVAKINGGVQK